MAAEVCPRCGHAHHEAPSSGETLRRLVGIKPRRATCGEDTEMGPCPCRSRFHTR
jgi:hypothetical protein